MSDPSTFMMDDQLPTLVFSGPTCSQCGEEVEYDGESAACNICLVGWDDAGQESAATPNDPEDGVCAEDSGTLLSEPYDRNGKHWVLGLPKPCILPTGHTGDHLHPYSVTTTPLCATN
jgi:hypothetical protein